MNNVPDPTLAGKDLPIFKFAPEKSDGRVIGNSCGKEATVTQLPISKGIAGVSMRLEPGAMRELHWLSDRAIAEGRRWYSKAMVTRSRISTAELRVS